MNAAVDRHIESLGPRSLIAAEISGSAHAERQWREFTSLDFPEFDLCAPLGEAHEGRYDVVICEQVLEHVIDPCGAAANLRRLCAPGGHVIVTSPFLIRIHELPYFGLRDYWRFTPRGLETLLENAGLEVGTVETWGNRQAVIGNLRHWAAYRPWHSLRNDPGVAVQVWAFARRPLAPAA
jgi:SAM-dependent methyltransferase